MKKKIKIVFIGICILAMMLLVGNILHNTGNSNKINSHIEMAQRYLEELNYEQAIVEYTAALEIEPNNREIQDALERVYLDMAQVQVDEMLYDEAIRILTSGYRQLQSETLKNKKRETEQLLADHEREEEQRKAEEEQRKEEERQAHAEEMAGAIKENADPEIEKRKKEEEEEKRRREEEIEKEFLEAKQEAEERLFGDNGDDPEIAGYKRQAADFIISLLKEQWEDVMTYIDNIKILENNDRYCRMYMSYRDGKPASCFEIEIDKEKGEGTIKDYFDAEIEDDGEWFIYGSDPDHFGVGRTFQLE